MTTTQSYAAFVAQAREATEKSVAVFAKATEPLIVGVKVQSGERKAFAEPVQRYFQYVQQAAVANVELATKWTELVAAFSGAAAVQRTADAISAVAADAAEVVVESATEGSAVVESVAAGDVDEADLESDLEAERAEAKHAHELAREPYRSLTKTELSALLAERGLPKTGTINTLIERLIADDTEF